MSGTKPTTSRASDSTGVSSQSGVEPTESREKAPKFYGSSVVQDMRFDGVKQSWWYALPGRSLRPISYRNFSSLALMQLLERGVSGFREPLTLAQMTKLVEEGRGELFAKPAAAAFVVNHGVGKGVEIRALVVAVGYRRRGAGRALIAQLRAHHAGEHLFCVLAGGRWTHFARRAGFAGQQLSDGGWYVTTDPTSMVGNVDGEKTVQAVFGRVMSPRQPDRSEPALALAPQESAYKTFLKAAGAIGALAAASMSCAEI